MANLKAELTDMAVKHLREPGLHFVGGVPGLALQVYPATEGSKGPQPRSWIVRYSANGKRREMGLGPYPEVTLAKAREAAAAARADARAGIDPIERRRAQRAAPVPVVKTFKQCAKALIAAHSPSWKNDRHRQQWTSTLEAYVYPVFGARPVADVQLDDVLEVLEPIWSTRTETAKRVRGRIEAILDYAKTRGYRDGENPARWRGHLDKLLARPSKVAQVKHHRALKAGQVGAFVRRLRDVDGMGARALEFLILTAARSGEVRNATWNEIDLSTKVWTIPAERMKAGKEHRVPLSSGAVELLEAVPIMAGSDLIFPAPSGRPLSDMTLSAVTRRMKVDAVPHGFRSTFKDWASEVSSYPSELAEIALAHAVGNKVEQAYRRGDSLERRRRMMTDWATFVSVETPPVEMLPVRKRA